MMLAVIYYDAVNTKDDFYKHGHGHDFLICNLFKGI
jgi:hypothetical protein